MKTKHFFQTSLLLVLCLILIGGCRKSSGGITADPSYRQSDISSLSVPPQVKVVGLGEASHGVKEYHEMKAEVFKALVANNGCRTFIIEGDFGGALKVNQYIKGGSGTAEEAVSEIGFGIYRTEELASLVEWMRAYNESVPQDQTLNFYGMDIQRFDNNKEFLFSLLDQSHPELLAEYAQVFDQLTDDNIFSPDALDKDAYSKAKEAIGEFISKMDTLEADIVAHSGQADFDFARECANTIYACCDLQLSSDYNTVRDSYMYEKVNWFLDHGDQSLLFINGHNGHIEKKAIAGYKCLGQLLDESLSDGYYAIGTDSKDTEFNSQDANGFNVVKVSNKNDLNTQFEGPDDKAYFIDFSKATADQTWKEIVSSEQRVTTLNVSLSGFQKLLKFFYTTTFVPNQMFDGMIVFQEVSPMTIFEIP